MNSVEGNMAEKRWGETLREPGTCLVSVRASSPHPQNPASPAIVDHDL